MDQYDFIHLKVITAVSIKSYVTLLLYLLKHFQILPPAPV